jgi:glycerophosphoryl diester phosphodiesterase
MTTVQELDLELTFQEANRVIHFDDAAYHGASTAKRVDFIAEYENHDLFVEIKDPDNPAAENPEAFEKKLKSENLVQSLSGKFRDTLFFRSIQGKGERGIVYIVLISMEKLDRALLLAKQDELRRSIPLSHADWGRDCATSCIVLNVAQWKKQFGENSLRRISEGAAA